MNGKNKELGLLFEKLKDKKDNSLINEIRKYFGKKVSKELLLCVCVKAIEISHPQCPFSKKELDVVFECLLSLKNGKRDALTTYAIESLKAFRFVILLCNNAEKVFLLTDCISRCTDVELRRMLLTLVDVLFEDCNELSLDIFKKTVELLCTVGMIEVGELLEKHVVKLLPFAAMYFRFSSLRSTEAKEEYDVFYKCYTSCPMLFRALVPRVLENLVKKKEISVYTTELLGELLLKDSELRTTNVLSKFLSYRSKFKEVKTMQMRYSIKLNETEAVLEFLNDSNPEIRLSTIKALKNEFMPKCEDYVCTRLIDVSADVRSEAKNYVLSYGALDSERSVARLATVLNLLMVKKEHRLCIMDTIDSYISEHLRKNNVFILKSLLATSKDVRKYYLKKTELRGLIRQKINHAKSRTEDTRNKEHDCLSFILSHELDETKLSDCETSITACSELPEHITCKRYSYARLINENSASRYPQDPEWRLVLARLKPNDYLKEYSLNLEALSFLSKSSEEYTEESIEKVVSYLLSLSKRGDTKERVETAYWICLFSTKPPFNQRLLLTECLYIRSDKKEQDSFCDLVVSRVLKKEAPVNVLAVVFLCTERYDYLSKETDYTVLFLELALLVSSTKELKVLKRYRDLLSQEQLSLVSGVSSSLLRNGMVHLNQEITSVLETTATWEAPVHVALKTIPYGYVQLDFANNSL